MAYEVATAYVSIVPSIKGVQKSVAEELSGVGKQTSKASGDLSRKVGKSLKKIGKIGAASIGGMAAGLGAMVTKGGFDRALQVEAAQTKLEGMKMSASQVEAVMSDALASVKGTAFGMGDAATVAAQLSAAGVQSGKDLESALSSVADIAQMSGSSLTEVGNIYGKVAAKGKLQGNTLNQLMERGIAVMPALQEHLGVTADEVQDMVSRGEIDFATFKDAMGDAFGGAALASGETLPGAFANFKAALARLGEGPGVKIMEALRNAFNDMIPAIDTLAEKAGPVFDQVGEWVGGAASKVADFFTGLVNGDTQVDWTMFQPLADGAGELWEGLNSVWDVLQPFVEKLGEAARDMLPDVVEFTGKVGEFLGKIMQNKTVISVIGGIATALAAVWAVGKASQFVGMMKLAVGSVKAFAAQTTIAKGASILFAGAQKLLNIVLAMNPIGIVVMALVALGAGLVLAWNKSETFRSIVTGAWEGIKSAVSSVWGFMRDVVWPGLKGFVENLVGKFQDFKAKISGAWDGVKLAVEVVSDFFTTTIKPRMENVATKVKNAFETMRKGVTKAWNAIKAAAAKPVNFVIDTVYNNGLRAGFNKVADAVGLKNVSLPRMPTLKYACGGVLPGYTPGRDVHKFWSPTAGGLELSGGEGIIRPDALRALGGAAWLNMVNRTRGRGLANVGDVGAVQRFKDGGVFGAVKSFGSKAWNGLLKAKDFIGDVLSDPGAAISNLVLAPARKLLDTLGSSMFMQIAKTVPAMLFNGVKSFFTKKTESIAGLDSKGVLGAAAKAVQMGTPYVWGGSAIPPGLDCSGLVYWANVQAGNKIPRLTAAGYQSSSMPVTPGKGRPGDLLFWGNPAWHVAIASGRGMMYEAPRAGMNLRHTPIWGNPTWGRLQKFDNGGYLETGYTGVVNQTGRPEPVFTPGQWDILKNGQGGVPEVLVVKDADGALIGRMRVEAALERQEAARRLRR